MSCALYIPDTSLKRTSYITLRMQATVQVSFQTYFTIKQRFWLAFNYFYRSFYAFYTILPGKRTWILNYFVLFFFVFTLKNCYVSIYKIFINPLPIHIGSNKKNMIIYNIPLSQIDHFYIDTTLCDWFIGFLFQAMNWKLARIVECEMVF